MIDALFRVTGFVYFLFFSVNVELTLYGSILDYVLVSLANAINVYIFLFFNAYVTRFLKFPNHNFVYFQITSSTICTGSDS